MCWRKAFQPVVICTTKSKHIEGQIRTKQDGTWYSYTAGEDGDSMPNHRPWWCILDQDDIRMSVELSGAVLSKKQQ